MAPKKGGANKKGKQPAKRKATPQVSPPQSSSDEESWPIWKQLQEKISALEAEKMATQLRQDGEYQPRRSTRDSSGHRRAKLKALASDLMERFNVLEADRGTRRNEMTESAGESSVFKSRHLERISDVSLPATPANPEIPDGSEDNVGIPQDTEADSSPSTSMGQWNVNPYTYTPGITWPWAGASQPTPTTPSQGSSQIMGPAGAFWPYAMPPVCNWGMIPPNVASASQGTPASAGGWPYPSVADTGYNTVPLYELPYGDYSTPLGDHLTPAVKEKIWKGQFVDVFELLNRTVEKADFDKADEADKERLKRKKPERNWTNWLSGYLIYAGVIVKSQPWRAQSLFQYLDIIHRAFLDFAGMAWLRYDQAFRMRSAVQPNLRWDEPQPGLWLQHMGPARTNIGERFDSGHLNKKSAVSQNPRLMAGQAVQPRMYCWEYNSKGVCSRRPCYFKHECSSCGGRHPNATCFKVGNQKQNKSTGGGKKPGSGGGAAGKGPQPN